MGALIFTPSAPSGTRSFSIVPSSTASNSIVALSVSISARMSPGLTRSPSFTCHLASLPSSMVGESAGIKISGGIFPLHKFRCAPRTAAVSDSCVASLSITNALRRRDHILNRRQCQPLEICSIWHWHIFAGDPDRRRIQIIKRFVHHGGGNLRSDGANRPTLLHSHDAVRPLHRLDHCLNVERPQRTQVNQFGFDAFLRQRLGS